MIQSVKRGKPRVIPKSVAATMRRMRGQGLSYQEIAKRTGYC